jgi:Fe-S-cluster-containing hydrogenase component 2
MIAAYEAEMNVVLHACRGSMLFSIENGRLHIQVKDEGPGIEDVDLAMQEGYSTASRAARDLGFGAGLGLPNIRKSADIFTIDSEVGKGTVLSIGIDIAGHPALEMGNHSIRINRALCRGDLRCVSACPTQAIRVRAEGPRILGHLCIDCTACMATCPEGVFGIDGVAADGVALGAAAGPHLPDARILVLPAAFLYQFGPSVSSRIILDVLGELGFEEILLLEAWEQSIREQTAKLLKKNGQKKPLIPPYCPAVINLVALRFPSLLDHIAALLSPIEAAHYELKNESALFAVSCPAQRSTLLPPASDGTPPVVPLAPLYEAVTASLGRSKNRTSVPLESAKTHPQGDEESGPGERQERDEGSIRVCGIQAVSAILDDAENGLLNDVPALELFACPEGCFGSPLLKAHPALARFRWNRERPAVRTRGKAVFRYATPLPRAGLRLDADMSRAISKLEEIEALAGSLPGRDCGACGSPSCAALAEDIVLGRATKSECVHLADGDHVDSRSIT